MSDAPSRNFALLVSYDGRAYEGWQRHAGKSTVQGTLEAAILAAFGEDLAIAGSGRTDRGAHANGQVVSVRLPLAVDAETLAERMNGELPGDIRVREAHAMPDDFHARESARGKRYRYVLWVDSPVPTELDRRVWTVRGPLDIEAMQSAMAALVGRHDFATFASKSRIKRKSTTRTITRAELTSDLPRIELTFEGDGFLYKMVRNLVRAVVKVGEGRHTSADLSAMLAARDRKAAPGSAPASGLYLDAVLYDPPLFSS